MDRVYKTLVERLAKADRVFVLTGAGLGVASGLGTFRGANGFWNNKSVESLASLYGFEADPEASWDWYNTRIEAYLKAEPNAGHIALADLEQLVPHMTLATQNVDGLHLRAGSKNVLELHGDLRRIKCTGCKRKAPIDGPFDLDTLEHDCGYGRWRPNVVWFGENLPEIELKIAYAESGKADVVIVAGTSMQVYPVANIAKSTPSDILFEINPDSALEDQTKHVIREGTEVALPKIVEMLKEMK